MDEFRFEGRIPTSKSLLNRGLILRSHAHGRFLLRGGSEADDVVFLKKSLGKIEDGKEFYLGDGGTTLRFFALRAAREKGSFTLKVSERLFQRPQKAMVEVLFSLGIEVEMGSNLFILRSRGWQDPEGPLKIPTADSSQFASAVVLNAWDLPFDLNLQLEEKKASESYFQMTLALCREAGMQIEEARGVLRIPAGQKIQLKSLDLEPDLSSLFSVAAMAALGGRARFLEVPEQCLQPDLRFVEILRGMGVSIEHVQRTLTVHQASRMKATKADLGNCPDLLPVLSILCAFSEGTSHLFGAPQLRHKESDRIQSTALLLRAMGIEVEELEDGLRIVGQPSVRPKKFTFDPQKDHRLAMAAGILMRLGWPLQLLEPEVVEKSFPEFWHLLRTGPHLVVGHRGTGENNLTEKAEVIRLCRSGCRSGKAEQTRSFYFIPRSRRRSFSAKRNFGFRRSFKSGPCTDLDFFRSGSSSG